MSKHEKITISILTHNRCQVLEKLVSKLIQLRHDDLQIIVVDNNSNDDTERTIKRKFAGVDYIRNKKNIGAAGRNVGLRAAEGDIIFTLDDDVFGLSEKHLNAVLNLFRRRPDIGGVNFKVVDHITGEVCNWIHHCDHYEFENRQFLTYEITEGAVAFRKIALEAAGYYPENFFLSHEGLDLALRMIDNGYKLIYTPKVQLVHCHSPLGRKKWTNYYYDTRNQFWVAARNFPVSYMPGYLIRGLASMAIYSIRDGFLRYWAIGVFDGLIGLKREKNERIVVKNATIRLMREIDQKRPGLIYYIKNRFFRKNARL